MTSATGPIPGGPRREPPPWQPWWTRRRVARLLSWLAVATSVVLFAATGAGYALLDYYDGNIDRLPNVIAGPMEEPPANGPLDILVVGSDSREGLTGKEAFQGKGDEFITGQRSDVVILVHVYGGGRQAQFVSLPRDTYVDIPAFQDPRTGKTLRAERNRLNAAFATGGPGRLVATVEQLTKIKLEHYVQVDFRGFKSLVDRLGGVEICLSKPQKDFRSGIDLPAGRQVVRGDQALAFVRQRQGLARGDIDRIRRQQLLLGALVRKVLSAGTLLNPVRLNGVLQIATTSLQVDDTLSAGRLRDLGARLRGLDPASVVFTTVPISDIDARRNGASVVLLDVAASSRLFERLRRDIPPGAQPPPSAPPAPPPNPEEQRTAADDPCTA